jgi:hypothetical protein
MRVLPPLPIPMLVSAAPNPTLPPKPQAVSRCVSDDLRVVASQVTDLVEIRLDDDPRPIFELKHGQQLHQDGSLARTFNGAGWATNVNLAPFVPKGEHRLEFIATHTSGDTAGAEVDLLHNGKQINVLSHSLDFHKRMGEFARRTVYVTMTSCQEESHERTTVQ